MAASMTRSAPHFRPSIADRALAAVARRLLAVPDRVALALARSGPIVVEGATLDPRVQLMLALAKLTSPGLFVERGVDEARREMDRSARMASPTGAGLEVDDRVLPGPGGSITIRVYRPRGLASPAPAIVYFHGGGFVIGSLASHDGVCRFLAAESRALVVSVDYRLAPEHPWPAAPDDAFAAYRWVREHAAELGVDAARISVAGDSAGGNLAAVVCRDAKLAGVPLPKAQALVYPATDLRRTMASHRTFAEGFLLTAREIQWFMDRYVPRGGDDLDHPRASPLSAEDLAGLPPALVVTAGFDPLRDEGRAYADRLEAAGVAVTYRCHRGLIHGFVSFAGAVPAARDALLDVATWLRERG